jgi:arylsulfatase A-like enzyme
MKRCHWVLALLVVGFCNQAFSAEAGRPNILFIYADDQPYKTMATYDGAPSWIRTPNLDRLARRGIQFQRAYLGSWCMPSRASLLTGRLPHAVESMRMAGEYPGSTYDPALCPFWPAVFRQNGYHTAQIGKWHTGTDTGWGRDWDYQIVWNRPAHPDNAGNYYQDQIMSFNGQERRVDGYSTDNYTQWAVEYIEGKHREEGKPWYLWLCYGAVHGPTTPAARHLGAYAGKEAPIPADIYGPWPDKPAYLRNTRAWERGRDGRPAMMTRRKREGNFDTDKPGLSYDAWVQQVNECALAIDEGIARLITVLETTGQLKNTLVVYTADQGYGLGEHGFSQKVAPYDATIASPLIISQPGTFPEGKHCRHPVSAPDLVSLFCQVAGITLPWKTHGRDIRPLLANPDATNWTSRLLFTHTGRAYGSDTSTIPSGPALTDTANVPWYALLRDGRYKYIRYLVEGETEEIYDLDADPEELRNLAVVPEHRELLETLRARTIEELKSTDAGFADSMPRTKAMMTEAR